MLALIGIVQKAVLGDHAYGGMLIYGFWQPEYLLSTPFGPYVNKNHFAGWMLLALPLALGYVLALTKTGLERVRRDWRTRLLWLSSARGGQLQLAAFAVVLMAVSLMLTMSRSGIACFGVAIAVAVVFGTKGTSLVARTAIPIALVLLLVVPAAWAGIDISSRFTSRGSESLRLRKDAWGATLRIIRDFPLTGTGLNTYGKATLQYRPDRKTQHFDEAHNDYLQLASEGGLLLTVPALGAVVFLVLAIRGRFREQRDGTVGYWLRFGAATSLLAIGLQSIVEFSLQMPGNAVLFVVLCAIAIHRVPDDRSAGMDTRRARTRHCSP
jgi:O-antigen ligase